MTPQQRPGGGSEAGFTIVELMFAMIILVIGLLGFLSTIGSTTRYQDLSSATTEMTLLADGKFELLRAAAASQTADTMQLSVGGSLTTPVLQHADTAAAPQGRVYVRLWQVVNAPGPTREVRLRVRPMVDDVRVPARLDFTTRIVTQ